MESSGVVIQTQHNCVLVSVQKDLDSMFLDVLRKEVLDYCLNKQIKGVILDLSGVSIIDFEDFKGIKNIILAAKLMGYPSVLIGLGAAVVSALVLSGADLDGIKAYNSLDQAFVHFA